MTLELAARLFCSLLALSLIVQTLEFMALGRMHQVRTIWHWSVQKQDYFFSVLKTEFFTGMIIFQIQTT